MYISNLKMEFELLRMKDNKTIKEFSNRLMKIVSQIRLLGEKLLNKKIIRKVLMRLPKRFELKISSLEDFKGLNNLSLQKLVSTLQA